MRYSVRIPTFYRAGCIFSTANLIYVVRAPHAIFPVLLSRQHCVLCHASMCVCLLPRVRRLIRREFSFFLLIFPPFNISVEHFAWSTPFVVRSFRSAVVQCFGFVSILEHIALESVLVFMVCQ